MIEITISAKKGLNKKLLNPNNIYLNEEEFGGIAFNSDKYCDSGCESAIETHILPATGDQRIWLITNLGEKTAPDLFLSQYKVIGYKVERDLFSDCTKILPLSTGLQWADSDCNQQRAYFLIDVDLKQITLIDLKGYQQNIDSDEQTTDIIGAISHALKIPGLAETNLPIELQDYLNPTIKKKVANLK